MDSGVQYRENGEEALEENVGKAVEENEEEPNEKVKAGHRRMS